MGAMVADDQEGAAHGRRSLESPAKPRLPRSTSIDSHQAKATVRNNEEVWTAGPVSKRRGAREVGKNWLHKEPPEKEQVETAGDVAPLLKLLQSVAAELLQCSERALPL